jgi:hypothetical protein
MRHFLATTTRASGEIAIREILKADPEAIVSHGQDNKTMLRVASEFFDEDKLEAVPGVVHAVDIDAMNLVKASL